LIELVLGEEEEVEGVEAEEKAEEEEVDALFVETSSEDTAGLVQNALFPTIYQTRMSMNLQSNPVKD
jgi:hypothetical protein